MDLRRTRLTIGLSEEERRQHIFEEAVLLASHIDDKSKRIASKSKLYSIGNTLINLSIICLSGAISIINGLEANIAPSVLGGLAFLISGANFMFKLGSTGYFYLDGSVRLKRIRHQIRNVLYLFHTFSSEEVLAFLTSYQTQVDEIDLDLYLSSLSGQAKFENEISIIPADEVHRNSEIRESPKLPTPRHSSNENSHDSENHIHIHIDKSTGDSLVKLEERKNSNPFLEEN